jgi:hypothetical protein
VEMAGNNFSILLRMKQGRDCRVGY